MYSVVGMDGVMYGPVDLPTLQRWCVEGRVAPNSTVIDARNGQQMFAQSVSSLAGCFTPQIPNYGQPQNPQAYTSQPYSPAPTPYGAYPRPGYAVGRSPKSKVTAMLLAFFFGVFGVHRFYLGHTSSAVGMLALCLGGCLCGFTWVIVAIWALIDMLLISTDSLVDASGQRLS